MLLVLCPHFTPADKELFAQSGILGLLERGDSVMADRGFDVHDLLKSVGVELNILVVGHN